MVLAMVRTRAKPPSSSPHHQHDPRIHMYGHCTHHRRNIVRRFIYNVNSSIVSSFSLECVWLTMAWRELMTTTDVSYPDVFFALLSFHCLPPVRGRGRRTRSGLCCRRRIDTKKIGIKIKASRFFQFSYFLRLERRDYGRWTVFTFFWIIWENVWFFCFSVE